jgi:hypothetical protein
MYSFFFSSSTKNAYQAIAVQFGINIQIVNNGFFLHLLSEL